MTAWETNNVALLVHKNRPTVEAEDSSVRSRWLGYFVIWKIAVPLNDRENGDV